MTARKAVRPAAVTDTDRMIDDDDIGEMRVADIRQQTDIPSEPRTRADEIQVVRDDLIPARRRIRPEFLPV